MEEEYSQMAVHERRSEDQRHQNLLNGRTRPEDIQPQELEFAQQITMMLKKPGKKLQFHKNVNVLIPSCGRRVELVKLFKKVFEIPRWEGKIFTCGCDWAMPAAYYSDKHFIVPEIYDPKYIDSIIKICDENEITYIFPVIDYDVKVLSHNKLNILRSVGTEVVCLESHYADICNDKFLTHQFFEKNGLSSPKTYQGVIPYASQITKFIMKPKFGFGSKNMKMIESTNRINDVPIEEGYVVQEFVEGVEYTCDIVSDRRYEIVSLVARKREAVRGGEIQQGEIVNHLGFYSQFSIVSKQLELIGPWCIQYIIDSNNQVHFIEINPRFGGGVPITARAGQNHALISLKVLQRDYSGYHNRYLVEWGLTALRFDDCTYKHIPEKKNHDSNGSIRLKG
jgi:carbamoyl-phosphate synthase large subunit